MLLLAGGIISPISTVTASSLLPYTGALNAYLDSFKLLTMGLMSGNAYNLCLYFTTKNKLLLSFPSSMLISSSLNSILTT